MLQQPLQRPGVERLAGGKENGIVTVPGSVHVCAMRNQQFHHRNSLAGECGAHQRCITSRWMSDPFSIIHFAMAKRVWSGGTRGTLHSATQVRGPSLA